MATVTRLTKTVVLLLLPFLFRWSFVNSQINCQADVVFVIDNSASIRDDDPPGGNNWLLILNFISDLVEQLNVGPGPFQTHVGLVDFGNAAYLDYTLSENQMKANVLQAVHSINYRGEFTNTTGGLKIALQLLTDPQYGARGPTVPKVIILLTDGIPNLDINLLPGVVSTIKNDRIRIVAVGVTSQVNTTLLQEMATSPSDYVQVTDFSSLDTVKQNVINNSTCQLITISVSIDGQVVWSDIYLVPIGVGSFLILIVIFVCFCVVCCRKPSPPEPRVYQQQIFQQPLNLVYGSPRISRRFP